MSIRVLHIQDHTVPQMSGYAFRSRALVASERGFGIEPAVVSSARHREFPALEESLDGIAYHRTPWPERARERVQLRIPFWRERVLTHALARRVRDVAAVFRPHVLHAHSPIFDGFAALAAGRRLGLPVVYQIRAFWEDDAVDKGKFREGSFVYRQVRRLETRVCREADRVVTICDGLRQDVVGRGIPPEKVLVAPNGVDAERFQAAPADPALLRRLGLEGKVVLGFVGSFFRYEGLPLLVEAVAHLREGLPELRVLLVGGGEDEGPTRARVRELGLEDRVLFTGRVPHHEVERYYGAVGALVYPRLSRRLTELVTPLKPLEAIALEKSVIASDVGGHRELLAGTGAGHLFRAGSSEDLARAILDWHRLPEEQRRRQREAASAYVKAHRTWDAAVERLLPFYEQLAGMALSSGACRKGA